MKLSYLILILAALALIADGKKKRKHKKHSSSSTSSSESDESLGESGDSDESTSESKESRRVGNVDINGRIRRKLAATVMKPGHSSVVCSPLSALKPIGMLVFGSKGKTEREMLKAIGVGTKSSVHRHFKTLLADLSSLSGLHMATRIYIDKRHRLRDTFKREATETFDSCIEQIDMRDASNVAREINSWIDYHTNNKIKRILQPEDIGGADIIIVDAIYFWGKWKYPFENTYQGSFHGYGGSRAVTMMTVQAKFNYGKKHNYEVVEIPYHHRDITLMIVIPDKNLRELSSIMDDVPGIINKVKMSKTKIKLTIPKFAIENTLDLGQIYKTVGLRRMFSSKSGLTGVSNSQLIIDQALQKVVIVIDDKGTEATGGLGAVLSPFPLEDSSKITLTVDHPFLFFIIGKKQQLFAGILT